MYASRSDIENLYTAELLERIAYDRDTSVVNDNIVTAALESATSEIEAHISGRYSIPLVAPVPLMIRQWAVDIAVYRICLTQDKMTEEIRKRYEYCRYDLQLVAKSQLNIGVPTITASGAVSNDFNMGRGSTLIGRRQG